MKLINNNNFKKNKYKIMKVMDKREIWWRSKPAQLALF